MKKTLRATLVMVMVLAMMFGSTVSAAAAEEQTNPVSSVSSENNDYGISTYGITYPYTGYGKALDVTTTYKKIAYSNTGFNCFVTIRCELNGVNSRGVVMMKDKNGNHLWTSSEEYLVPSHGSFEYWCGSDVYSIWIKTTSGFGSAWVEM